MDLRLDLGFNQLEGDDMLVLAPVGSPKDIHLLLASCRRGSCISCLLRCDKLVGFLWMMKMHGDACATSLFLVPLHIIFLPSLRHIRHRRGRVCAVVSLTSVVYPPQAISHFRRHPIFDESINDRGKIVTFFSASRFSCHRISMRSF